MISMDLLLVALWTGLLGFYIGYTRGIRHMRPNPVLNFVSKGLTVTVEWHCIERVLEQRGLIAVPKGADFVSHKAPRP